MKIGIFTQEKLIIIFLKKHRLGLPLILEIMEIYIPG